MWGKRRQADHHRRQQQLAAARAARLRAEAIRRRIEAQEPEVTAVTERLEERIIRNNFAAAMYSAMGQQTGEQP